MKLLCVAEKPSISKEVASILSGGRYTTRHSKNKFIKNYDFQFEFATLGRCEVTMTCVAGHITGIDVGPRHLWGACAPGALLDAELITKVTKQDIFDNITNEARSLQNLMIWTDCDREGEYIGHEIFEAAKKGNSRMLTSQIWRSKFLHLERSHVLQAANHPIRLDMNAVNAVATRIEVDFRVGTSFTRLFTDVFRGKQMLQKGEVISYGTCQFPTLGFIVDRYKRVKLFVPEPFWYINVLAKKDNKKVPFNWTRNHFFDRLFVVVLYQRCLKNTHGTISKLELKRTSNYKPLPLTTVELQKECSRIFKMSAKRALDAAEKLYNKGFISYPRTETNKLPASMDFKSMIAKHGADLRWGNYAQELVNTDKFSPPREGNRDDKAHPAIHPVQYVDIKVLDADEQKVYEYVVRRFLACCSKDALGQQTTATLKWGEEYFTTSGLIVLERNYLDVFTYRKWESSKQLPNFVEGESLPIAVGEMKEGKTSAPSHMTETELIALMDANGIGTDATIAEHIEKVIFRGYVVKQKVSSAEYILPTPLGMGLVEGLDSMNFDNMSLSKPFLRKMLEGKLQDIADGKKGDKEVLKEVIELYRRAYSLSALKVGLLVLTCQAVMRNNL